MKEAVAARPGVIVAGGGDGTVSTVAAALVDTDISLGVLPLGTLNHFAKDLGLPLELDAAVGCIAGGATSRVDVGEVNGRVFVNNSSLGLYPDIVRDREQQQKRFGRGKWHALLRASIAALRRYPFLHVSLTVEGRERAYRTPFVFIGNNDYRMEGLALGERTALDDGLLSLYVAQRPGRLRLVQLALRALLGRLRETRDFDQMHATEIRRGEQAPPPARGHRRRGHRHGTSASLPHPAGQPARVPEPRRWQRPGREYLKEARCAPSSISPTSTSAAPTRLLIEPLLAAVAPHRP